MGGVVMSYDGGTFINSSLTNDPRESGASAPFISGISEDCLDLSATTTIVVEGTGFTPSTIFQSDPSISFSNYVYLSSTQIQVDVTTGSGTGYFAFHALNGTESSGQFVNSFNQIHVTNKTLVIPGDTTAWQNITSGVATGNGFMEASAYLAGWNQQATFPIIGAGQAVKLYFTLGAKPNAGTTSTGYGMFGFGVDPTANTSHNTIDHAIYIQNFGSTGNVYIYENGSNRGLKTTAQQGDEFIIERDSSGVVKYYVRGDLVYTSTVASTGAIHFDSSIYRNIRLEKIKAEAC